MADGDITKIQILGRVVTPGGGNTTTGRQVQNKVMVWGKIACTAADAGINPGATASVCAGDDLVEGIGLDVLDFIELTLNGTDGEPATMDKVRYLQYDTGDDLIFTLEDIGAAQPTFCTAGDVLDIRFLAIGDADAGRDQT